jgi:hypothetical protein
MGRSIRAYTKLRRADQAGTMIGVRLQPDALAPLDAWIARQPDPKPTRPEAIRRLIELGLSAVERAPKRAR